MKKVLISLIAFLSVAINAFGITDQEYDVMYEASWPYVKMLKGNGVPQDKPTAMAKLKEQADAGNYFAAGWVADSYEGYYEDNPVEAEKYYRIGVKGEISWIINQFADFLWYKKNIECMKWYRKNAEYIPEKYGYYPINAARKIILDNSWEITDDERVDLVIDLIDGVYVKKNMGAFLNLLDLDLPGLEDNEKLKQKYDELWNGAYQEDDIYQEFGIAWMQSKGLGVKKDLSKALNTYLRTDVGYVTDIALGVIFEEKNDVASAKRFYNQAIQKGYKKDEWLENHLKALDEMPELANDYYGYPKSKCYWKKGTNGTRNVVNAEGKMIVNCDKYKIVGFDYEVIIVRQNGKVGAIDYSGKLVVPCSYTEFEGTGKEGRLVFASKTASGVKIYIFTKTGALLVSKSFTSSQPWSTATFLKDWLGTLGNPAYKQ